MPHPFLEDVDEELTVLSRPHRALGDQVARLGVEQALAPVLAHAPPLVGDGQGLGAGPFDDGDELHPLRAQVVAEEPIDVASVALVGRVDRAQDVELHPVAAQQPPPVHHLVPGALRPPVDTVGVVQLLGAVDAEADEEVVLGEELAPLVVEQDAVGLERVLHHLVGPAVLLDQLDRLAKELDAHQGRFATLPGDGDVRCPVRLEQLADVRLQRGGRHAALVVRVQRFLGQEEAVGAVDVARRPARFGEQVEAGWCVGRPCGHRGCGVVAHSVVPTNPTGRARDGFRRCGCASRHH